MMKEDNRTAILRQLGNGLDFKAACEKSGITRQSGYRMRKADPWFDGQVKRLLARREAERQRLEAEADLRGKQNQDPRQQEPPGMQQPPPCEIVPEYTEGSIQYEPVVKLASDPDFKPGFQPEWRARELDARLAAEADARRRANYHPLDGLRRE